MRFQKGNTPWMKGKHPSEEAKRKRNKNIWSKKKDGPSISFSHGYYQVWMPEHPIARKNGHISLHRMIAYDAGILTDISMVVHHINGIKTDNRVENLQALPKEKHLSITHKGRYYAPWSKERRLARSKLMTQIHLRKKIK